MPLIEVSLTNVFRTAIKNTQHLVVVDFYAPWCGPCKALGPTLANVAEQFKNVTVLKANVDVLQDIAAEYNVTKLPTVVFLRFGREVDRVIGLDRDAITKRVVTHAV